MGAAQVLIVEDETKLAELMRDYLRQSGFETHHIGHGDEVMPWLADNTPEAILLDLMLPGKDGMTLCREIRERSDVPILMVTARVDEVDRLVGLELGADDYICKPFSPREVVARVKTVLRRARGATEPNRDLVLDDDRQQLQLAGKTCEFTTVEYQLVRQLVGDPGRIFSRAQLMDGMYSDHRVVSDRTIDSHIKKIRRKLDELLPGEYQVNVGMYDPDNGQRLPLTVDGQQLLHDQLPLTSIDLP